MDMERLFRDRNMNVKKMLAYGFTECENGYVYLADILEGRFQLKLYISKRGVPSFQVVDADTNEEYALVHVANAEGAFVGKVREACKKTLEKIAAQCFDAEIFKSEQAKRVAEYIWKTYRDGAEFLWEKSPENAVFRRKDNAKWYAVLLHVKKCRLGLEGEEAIDIIDLKMEPSEAGRLVDGRTYLPGYHMNKKHWFTICMDGTVSLAEILERIDKSYILAECVNKSL